MFETFEDAERWIVENRLAGTLTRYPVGVSVYDWAVGERVVVPKKPEHASPDFIANFSSAAQEHYHYDPEDEQ